MTGPATTWTAAPATSSPPSWQEAAEDRYGLVVPGPRAVSGVGIGH